MRVLGIGNYNDLGSIYMRCASEGHDARVFIAEEGSRDVLRGLVPQEPDLEAAIAWAAADDHVILVEDSGWGAQQDAWRARGLHVLGSSMLGDRLEEDRAFGQQVLRDAGLHTLPTHTFESFTEAIEFVNATPCRYVLKFHGSDLPSNANYVGMRDDASDMLAVLAREQALYAADDEPEPAFSLMAFVAGVETGLGAFFDGNDFVGPINLDWEHKRLFPGDLGELTGEMGTVVTYRGGEKLFAATLARVAPLLRSGHHVGYVNLNTIINADGIWPLEFTCRFGYPGFAILSALFHDDCARICRNVAAGTGASFTTHDGFAIGVVLTVPPFPYHHGYEELGKGQMIHLPRDLTDDERRHLHFGEVALDRGALVTAGQVGYVMVVTGNGPTIAAARAAAYGLAGRIAIPNMRYRNDIGTSLEVRGLAELSKLGWYR
ncbi:MAG: phosphoribosylglycinamide synthetase C domain-containing protein [Kofleriaceae bacterium]